MAGGFDGNYLIFTSLPRLYCMLSNMREISVIQLSL